MDPWTSFVGLLYSVLLALSQLYGGSMGAAILTFTLLVRLALLPLSVRAARRVLWTQHVLAQIKPELERLKQRYGNRRARLDKEVRALYERHNLKPFDARSIGGVLLQVPLFLGLYSAIERGLVRGGRFLWICDLAKPDALLAILAAGLSGFAAVISSPAAADQSRLSVVLAIILTFVVLTRLAAGLGLYVAASNSVSILQAWIVRRMGPAPA